MLVRWKKAGNSNRVFRVDLRSGLCGHKKNTAICLQKLQAVGITFLLFNFLEEYIIVKRTLTTFTNFLELYWKCACVGPIFFKMHSQNVFIQGSSWIYKVRSSTVDTKTKYLCIIICPKKFKFAHKFAHSSWYFKTHARSDTSIFAEHYKI